MHAENVCFLRTIDIYLQAVWANPRFITINQGKNVMLCHCIFNKKIPVKIENTRIKKVETVCVNKP